MIGGDTINKWEKEVMASLLDSEEETLIELEKQYKRALNDIGNKIKAFQVDIDMLDAAIQSDGLDDKAKEILKTQRRSKVYQKQFQEALKGQVSGILDQMQGNNYQTIESYLKQTYEDAYIGTMYDLHGQGIPVITPIDQAQAVKAVLTDSKISKGLYTALGLDVARLKKSISAEITRGIATSLPYSDIARNLSNVSKAPLSRARTIVRTEGHRIQQASTMDAQNAAKAKGADVVKQWDAALDGRTRPTHRQLDGQIREVDEMFEVAGKKAKAPGYFGDPAEDCNCRCVSLTRARWALDDDELQTLKDRAKFFGLDKTKDLEDFKDKYLKASKNVASEATNAAGVIDKAADVSYIVNTYGSTHAQATKANLDNADPEVRSVWNKYQKDFKTSDANYSGSKAYYSPSSDNVTLNIARVAAGNSYSAPYQTLYHEYGHMTDYLAARSFGYNGYVAITEVFDGLDQAGKPIFTSNRTGGLLGRTAKDELKNIIKDIKKKHGVTKKTEAVQILIDEINSNYSLLARADVSDILEGAGIGVGYPLGVGHGLSYWKNRDNGKEIFAEIISSETANADSLDCIKKYFPETYKVFRTILGVIK